MLAQAHAIKIPETTYCPITSLGSTITTTKPTLTRVGLKNVFELHNSNIYQ
jgi:hypothetical protein